MRDIKNVFIVGKPMQIIVSASIIKQLRIENSSKVIIFDSFYDAHGVYKRLKSVDVGLLCANIDFIDTYRHAIKTVRSIDIENIFIGYDVGFRIFLDLSLLKMSNRNVKINVFEEGVGTYRSDLYSGVKKVIFDALGIGTSFGGCYFTDGVYVFEDDQYRETFPGSKAGVVKILCGITDVITSDFRSWSYIMNYKEVEPRKSGICNIYLSSWNFDTDFLQEFCKMDGDKFIKPHPHIKENLDFTFAKTLGQTAPAELILLDLAQKYNSVSVFHHGTSSQKYVHKSNVHFFLC